MTRSSRPAAEKAFLPWQLRVLLTRHLPDDAASIRKLIELNDPPPAPVRPPEVETMPHAVTFFLTGAQRRSLFGRLRSVARDRSEALVRLLRLDER